jgi:hypothetical protein
VTGGPTFTAKLLDGPHDGETRPLVEKYPYVVLSYRQNPTSVIRWAKYEYTRELDPGLVEYKFYADGEWGTEEPYEKRTDTTPS